MTRATAKDLFGHETPTPPLRRKSVCGRDPRAGPGTCWFWWESCPDKIPDCFARRARAADAAGVEARQAFLKDIGLT